jgi:hypothetical protein
MLKKKRKMLWILFYGKRINLENHIGIAPGVKEDPVGI